MARLNTSIGLSARASTRASTRESTAFDNSSLYASRTPTPVQETHRFTQASSTPGPSSDKENHGYTPQPRTVNRAKSKTMGPPSTLPTPGPDTEKNLGGNKRRRLATREASVATSIATDMGGRVLDPTQYYDPDQNPEQRREVVKEMRLLTRELQERRDDLDVEDLSTLLIRSNQNMGKVKQTSDATIDSRFLVAASDLVTKKTAEFVMGDAATRIDIDEFVSKCVTFMRSGGLNGPDDDGLEPPSAQARARRRTQRPDAHSDDEDEEDNGDALAWDVLGEQACFPNNCRPPVPGFLLGPLSVQKRVRATQTQRRPRLQRDSNLEQRPDTLKPQDLQQAENSNLVTIVKGLKKKLQDVVAARLEAVEEELGSFIEDPTEQQIEAVASSHRLIRNEEGDPEIPLLEWVVNPNSFGQTVENLFYTSFLIREGNAAIGKDKRGLPTLRPADPRSLNEQRQQQVQRHQAVLSIDYPTWQTFIRALDLQEPIIPHRNDEQATQAVRGWYG